MGYARDCLEYQLARVHKNIEWLDDEWDRLQSQLSKNTEDKVEAIRSAEDIRAALAALPEGEDE